jgi:hypothetical protein
LLDVLRAFETLGREFVLGLEFERPLEGDPCGVGVATG